MGADFYDGPGDAVTPKQKIDEILKRYGVSYGEFNGRTFIDERYVAKLEKLVLELGEMSEELDEVTRTDENGVTKSIPQWESPALTRLNKLLDEMK